MSQTFREFFDLTMPTGLTPLVFKKSVIKTIEKNKNPIFIQLEDGTKLYFTWDEFNRIEGKPENGKKMLVIMQRREDDNSPSVSQIQKCKIINDLEKN
jgi:hypothetical protein